MNKSSTLICLLLSIVAFIAASGYWKNEPSMFTAIVRLIAFLLSTSFLVVWWRQSNKVLSFVVIPMVGIGMILNSIAILSNGGFMPIDPKFEAVGYPKYYIEGGNMLWLGDSMWNGNSIGDFFVLGAISIGLVIVIVNIYKQLRKKVTQ